MPGTPLNLQVAFQGGGAKIALLLAAAEALQELSAGPKPRINITRIAGTSAGAIVGALLAAKCPIAKVRESLAGAEGKALLERFGRPGVMEVTKMVTGGGPFWDDEPLRAWLAGQLKSSPYWQKNSPMTIGALQDIKLTVVSSDLVASGTGFYAPEDDLVDAVIDSAALPFCFRTWNHDGKQLRVDGGLCENLPIDRLQVEDEKQGPVIAFTFDEAAAKRPTNVLDFGLALFNTAINHSVRSARSRLAEEAVFSLSVRPPIETFDFVPALEWLRSDGFGELKQKARTWITKFVSDHLFGPSQQINGDFWRRPNGAALRDQMRRIGRLYRDLHEQAPLRFHSVMLLVKAHSLAAEGEPGFSLPDEVVYAIEVEADKEPVFAHRLSFSNPTTSAFFGHYSLEVRDPGGTAIEFETFASIAPEQKDATDRQMIVFFKRPLMPEAGKYTIILRDLGKNLLQSLTEQGWDGVDLSFRRAAGKVGRITIGLHVPLTYEEIVLRETESSAGFSARELNGCPLWYRSVAWEGSDIEPFPEDRDVRVRFGHRK